MAKKERLPGFWFRKHGHQEEPRTVALSLRREVRKAYGGLLASSLLVSSHPLVRSGRRTEDVYREAARAGQRSPGRVTG